MFSLPALVSGWFAMDEMLFFRIGCGEALEKFAFCLRRERGCRGWFFGLSDALVPIGKRIGTDSAKFPRQSLAADFDRMVFQGDSVLTEGFLAEVAGVWVF